MNAIIMTRNRIISVVVVSCFLLLAGSISPVNAAVGDYLSRYGSDYTFFDVAGVAIDQGGLIYTTEGYGEGARVSVFNPDGTLLYRWGDWCYGPDWQCPEGTFMEPSHIAIDESNVYVLDKGRGEVDIFSKAGEPVNEIPLPLSTGEWDGVWGLAVDHDHRIYVSGIRDQSDPPLGEIRVYDISGALLTSWNGEGTNGAGVAIFFPGDVAIQQDRLYVTDRWANRTRVYDTSGNFIRDWGSTGSGDGQFNRPQGVSIGPDGLVYVADTGNDRIQVFSPDGTFIRKWGEPGYWFEDNRFGKIVDISVDRQGKVYTVDSDFFASHDNSGDDFNRVTIFNETGGILGVLQGYGLTGSGLYDPTGIAVDDNNNVYVTDPVVRYQVVSQQALLKFHDTSFIRRFDGGNVTLSGTGDGQFRSPGDVTYTNDKIFVADTGNDRIQVFDRSTSKLREIWGSSGQGSGQFLSPTGICTGGYGDKIIIADTGNNRIQIFSDSGTFIKEFGSPGTGDGQFASPTGVSYGDYDTPSGGQVGAIFVADTGNNRIQVFNMQGAFLDSWGSVGSLPGQLNAPSGIAAKHHWDGSHTIFVADTGNDRIQEFGTNGTFIRGIGESGTGELQFDGPQKVAVDSSDGYDWYIYVTDTGNNRVVIISDKGTYIGELSPSGDNQLNGPSGIWVSEGGGDFAYLADTGNDRIVFCSFFDRTDFKINGTYLASIGGGQGSGPGEFNPPIDVAYADTPSGLLYVADPENSRVQVFSRDGTFLFSWGSPGTGNGQFSRPQGVSVGSDGLVYVADTGNNRIQVFDLDGTFLNAWGGTGTVNGKFNGPTDLTFGYYSAFDEDFLYVSDTGNNRIQAFRPDGSFFWSSGSSGTADGQFNNPHGITTDRQGAIYVADTGNNRIQVLTEEGRFYSKFGLPGTEPGFFQEPYDIGFAPNYRSWGDLPDMAYISDRGNNRIQVWYLNATEDPDNPIIKWKYVASFGTTGEQGGEFNKPSGLTLFGDRVPYLFVADEGNFRVQKIRVADHPSHFAPKGNPLETTTPGPDVKFYGVAISTDGTMYILNAKDGTIDALDQEGNLLRRWGRFGESQEDFSFPVDIAVDNADRVYVLDKGKEEFGEVKGTGVLVFDSKGIFIRKFGSAGTGDGQLHSPDGIAVGPTGNIYVLDASGGFASGRVSVFDPEGNFLRSWSGIFYANGGYPLIGIAVDDFGHVYVNTIRSVKIFTENGEFLTDVGNYPFNGATVEHPDNPGYFLGAQDIAVTHDGMYIYVTDSSSHHVDIFQGCGASPSDFSPSLDLIPYDEVYYNEPFKFSVNFTDPYDDSGHTAVWDWGDGTTTEGTIDEVNRTVSGVHTYIPGNIRSYLTLTISDTTGNTDLAYGQLSLTEYHLPRFSNETTIPTTAYIGEEITFQVDIRYYHSLDNLTAEWWWEDTPPEAPVFEPAVIDTQNGTIRGTHIYSTEGVYTTRLIVSSSEGGSAHTYLPEVTITLSPLNEAPTIREIVYEQDQPTINNSTTIHAIFNDSEETDTHTATWYWGDSTTSAGIVDEVDKTVSGSHVFTEPLIFIGTLQIYDSYGNFVNETYQLDITTTGFRPYIEYAGITPNPAGTNSPVLLIGKFHDHDPGETHTASIDWGDGTSSIPSINEETGDITAIHPYTQPGRFLMNLTVTDGAGNSVSSRKTATVIETTEPPIATLTASLSTGSPPLDVSFWETSEGFPSSWNWSFGDGSPWINITSPIGEVQDHVYTRPGIYTARVIVANAFGSDEATIEITVTNPVPAITDLSPYSLPVGGDKFVLVVNGTGFIKESVIRWNGENRTTNYVSPEILKVHIPAADLVVAGTANVTVFNPPPEGGTSNTVIFRIQEPQVIVTDISPETGNRGTTVTIKKLSGSGFLPGAIVVLTQTDTPDLQINISSLTSKKITGTVLIPKTAKTGYRNVNVINPDGTRGTLANGFMIK